MIIIAISSIAQTSGTFIDSRDGKTYKTVKIGTQTWMAENLAYKTDHGCWAKDGNQSNVITYGYLYAWKTANKVCPSGWHLPSDDEWKTLTDYLGGAEVAGGKLKSTNSWKSFNTGASNSSGFTALPGGYRSYEGTFSASTGDLGIWWTSTETKTGSAWRRVMSYLNNGVQILNDLPDGSGFSVRCLKD